MGQNTGFFITNIKSDLFEKDMKKQEEIKK